MFGGLYQVLPSASSPEPLPQEEEKLPQRNANPGIKVCSRPLSPMPIPWAGSPLCAGEPLVSCSGRASLVSVQLPRS